MPKPATVRIVAPLRLTPVIEMPIPTRAQLTRAFAKALAKEDKAQAALDQARAEVAAAFGPWAAGRSISRDTARTHLASTGHLPERKL